MTDRGLVDVVYAHLGNNFVLDFHEDELRDVQARQETTTGIWGRSYQASVFMRPTNSVDATTSYFLPNKLGGDHAFKAGYRWRTAHTTSINHRGGYIDARFTNGVANSADIWRDEYSESHLSTQAFYAADTFTKNKLTVNLGFRLDIQDDAAIAGAVPANPFFPTLMPSVDFKGADAGVVWKDFSPRIGATYDLTGNGRNVLSGSFATYYGQMAPGQLSSQLAATGAVFVRYPWTDTNGDTFVQASEVNTTVPFLSKSGAYDPANPTNTASPTRVDPNIKNDRTQEFIVGFDRQLAAQMAVGGSYIWRKYDQFTWTDRDNFTSANYLPVVQVPTGCPAGARCETVTYYQPNVLIPSPGIRTNTPDRHRDFNGFELTFQKRNSNHWSLNASAAYNNAIDYWDSANAYEDPTNIDKLNGYQYAPESAGSGIGGIFTNAKWLFKVNGRYTMKWDINLAANYQARQGYPYLQTILSPNRANGAGTIQTQLDPLGELRLDNLQTVDVRVDKTFRFGSFTLVPAIDIFNLGNANTVQAVNRNQLAANANLISGILAPRVMRFGINVRW